MIHCFTESYDIAKKFIDECDVFLGIGGAVTFRKATDLQDAVTRLPLDRLVLETDCPYMAPVPYRGKRNEPAYMRLTCEAVAALRATTADEIAAATTANAEKLFPKLRRCAIAPYINSRDYTARDQFASKSSRRVCAPHGSAAVGATTPTSWASSNPLRVRLAEPTYSSSPVSTYFSCM